MALPLSRLREGVVAFIHSFTDTAFYKGAGVYIIIQKFGMVLKENTLAGVLKNEKGRNWVSIGRIIGRNFQKIEGGFFHSITIFGYTRDLLCKVLPDFESH